MTNKDKGFEEAVLDGITHEYQYEISNVTDTNFDLTVWYMGQSITERCPCYLANPHDDVRAPHGPLLLAKLIGGKWTPT
jgi:hypothetical protein